VLDTIESKEQCIVLYNLLKKIIDNSYSSSPILAIYSPELNILTKNCLLLRVKDRDLFFVNPQLLFCGDTMTIIADNFDYSFEGKEMIEVIFYFYSNKYLDTLPRLQV